MRPLFLESDGTVLQARQERTCQLRAAHTALRTEQLVKWGGSGVRMRCEARLPVSLGLAPVLLLAALGVVVWLLAVMGGGA